MFSVAKKMIITMWPTSLSSRYPFRCYGIRFTGISQPMSSANPRSSCGKDTSSNVPGRQIPLGQYPVLTRNRVPNLGDPDLRKRAYNFIEHLQLQQSQFSVGFGNSTALLLCLTEDTCTRIDGVPDRDIQLLQGKIRDDAIVLEIVPRGSFRLRMSVYNIVGPIRFVPRLTPTSEPCRGQSHSSGFESLRRG